MDTEKDQPSESFSVTSAIKTVSFEIMMFIIGFSVLNVVCIGSVLAILMAIRLLLMAF